MNIKDKQEPRLLARIEVDECLFVLHSALSSFYDYFIVPEDVKSSMLDLIELLENKLGFSFSYDCDVTLKLFTEVYEK